MKEVEHKDAPEVSGGQVGGISNPVPITYPIYPIPVEPPNSSPLIVPEAPLS